MPSQRESGSVMLSPILAGWKGEHNTISAGEGSGGVGGGAVASGISGMVMVVEVWLVLLVEVWW